MVRIIVASVLAVVTLAQLASGQDFEQVNTTSPQALSNKTLISPNLSGTTTIGAGATLTSPNLTTPTISNPILSGTATGTYTLGGTPAISAGLVTATGTITPATQADRAARAVNVKDETAVGDGVTDDRQAFLETDADTVGPITCSAGTYLIGSNLTLTSPVYFTDGCLVKPASGVTITLNGGVLAADTQKLFDMSAGGTVVIKNMAVSVRWFGALGDDVADDTTAFQNAAASSLTVYIPPADVDYRLTGTILLRSYAKVFGDGFRSSVVWRGGDFPVFAHTNYTNINAAGSEWVTLDNFRINDTVVTARVNNWTLNFSNAKNIMISRMRLEGRGSATNTDLYGLFAGFTPGTTYSGDAWLIHVYKNRTSSFKMWLNSGDNFVEGNSWYGYTRDYAMRFSGEVKVLDNEIGGGEIQGGVYLDNSDHIKTIAAVKIIGNHFDGNATQNTGTGIYAVAAQPVRGAVITGNTSFNQNKEFVRLENSQSAIIAHNEMRDMDANDTGEVDIYVSGWANVIGPNTHIRSNSAPKAGVRVNLALPVHVVQATGTDLNVVIPGTVADDSADYLSKSFVALDALGFAGTRRLFDDFHGFSLDPSQWSTAVGTNGNCGAATIVSGSVAQLIFGNDVGGTMALNGSQLSGGLHWNASSYNTGEAFETALKLNTITDVALFVGLTDQNAALEMPFTLAAGNALTSNATDGVGFLFDTAADTDAIWLVGVKADMDTQQNTGQAYVANTNIRLRVEVLPGGAARFFINGIPVGSVMTNSVTSSVKLTPVIAGFSRTNATRAVSVDYIWVEASRN